MTLSEKPYTLRKKNGFFQEQLAEQLGVSRHAISKWETGQFVPESDKLIAISNYFKVSLDYLLKENVEPEIHSEKMEKNNLQQISNKSKWLLGMIVCTAGVVCLVIWGGLSILNPDVSGQLSQSSAIHMDGNGIFLILCIAAIVIGAVLLLKSTKK